MYSGESLRTKTEAQAPLFISEGGSLCFFPFGINIWNQKKEALISYE